MFFNRTNRIVELLEEHTEAVKTCYWIYEETFSEFVNLQSKDGQILYDDAIAVRLENYEHKADIKKHQVIRELLLGGMLVDSRKSTMRLVEGLDGIADTASDVIDMLVFERIRLHEDMIQPLMDIHRITGKQLEIFINVLVQLVSKYDFDKMLASISKIEELESEVDTIEKRLIKAVYGTDMELSQKLQYKDLITLVTGMSDSIEDLSDEVEIILASRRI